MAHLGRGRERDDLADHLLAQVVGRVGLAGEHELHRALGRGQQRQEPIGLGQQQGGPLVGGEPAGEAHGEGLGVEYLAAPGGVGPAEPPGGQRRLQALPHRRHQPFPALVAHPPQLLVAHPFDAGPPLGRRLRPGRQHGAAEQVVHLRGHPGVGVHAVGDRADGYLVDGHAGPQGSEHRPADLPVQPRHGVGAPGQAQAHDGHVERGIRRLAGLVAKCHEVVEGHPALGGPGLEVTAHEGAREAVDAGGHRRVGGEDAGGARGFQGLGEAQPLVEDGPPDALQAEEPGVALVGVEDLRRLAHRLQGPDPSDAEQDLLAQAVLGVAAVEPVGDAAALGVVLLDIGVEQVQPDAAHLGSPHPGHEGLALQLDADPGTVDGAHRHGEGIEAGVALLLPPIAVQRLAEVAVAVEQAHSHERDAEVAGRLEVIAGEHSEAAGVLG